jgi:hypothetical protein
MRRTTIFFAPVVAAVAMLIATENVNAQTKETSDDSKAVRLGVGFNAGIPTDNIFSVVLGGDLRLQKDFSSNLSGTLSAGYTSFSFKDISGVNIGYIPVKVGVKVFPVENFYISGEIGAGFGTKKGQGTSLVYAPGIGIGFNNGIDLGLRYEDFTQNGLNFGQVALRVAYGFNLSK